MARNNQSDPVEPVTPPVELPKPAPVVAHTPVAVAPTTARLMLDRTFTHTGKHYGPGEVEVPLDVAADLRKAVKRVQAADAGVDAQKKAIDELENQRRAEASKADVQAKR